jgi:hypothetical protein
MFTRLMERECNKAALTISVGFTVMFVTGGQSLLDLLVFECNIRPGAQKVSKRKLVLVTP